MGWVAGPRLVSATAEAGALGILASATMTYEQLEQAILEVKGRTDRPFGVNLRADAEDAAERVDAAGARTGAGRVVRARAERATDQDVEGRGHAGGAVDRRPPPRREGRGVGRRRGDRAGRRRRRPHRFGRDHAAAAASGRRGRHPRDRRGRVLRRTRSRRRTRLRRGRDRDGHPLPAHPRQHGAGIGEAATTSNGRLPTPW